MSFSDKLKEARLNMRYLVVFEWIQCQNIYGVSPCTAGRRATGTAQAGADRSITLNAGASSTDDIFNGMVVRITGGTGSGQEQTILDYDGTTKLAAVTQAWAINPDATSTFDIINRPRACFNTRFTCQDPANFVTGTREVKHTMKDRPFPLKGEVTIPDLITIPKYRPGKIDPRTGKLENSSITLSFADGPHNDVGEDKYIEWRTYNAEDQGTYHKKFNARNPHYGNREARIKRGFAGDLEADMETSMNFVESISFKGSEVDYVFKDRLKRVDKVDLPVATNNVTINGAVGAGAGTVAVSDASELIDPVASGRKEYIAVNENVIRYTGISGNNLTGCTWQKFGSSQAALSNGDTVQQAWGFEDENAADIAHLLFNDVGIVDADIDVTLFESERDTWLQNAIFTGVWIKPTKAKKILEQLQLQSMFNNYWDESDQKVKLKVTAPPSPLDTIVQLTDKDFLETPLFDNNEKSRLSRVYVAYAKRSAFDDDSEWQSFAKAFVVINATAEEPDLYGEPAIQNLFSRWITTDIWASRVANRLLSRFNDRAAMLTLIVASKDSEIAPADIIEITTAEFVDFFGAPRQRRQVQVLSREQKNEIEYKYVVMDTAWSPGGNSGGQYGYISPTGWPDYDSATDEERKYAYAGATGTNAVGVDEDPGYYIF